MASKTEITLSDREFKLLSEYIESNVGIKMPPAKKLMMQSRLAARLKALSISTFQDYINFVFGSGETNQEELVLMIDAITTNLTEFFRESAHFDYMTSTALPALIQTGHRQIKLWSAGCSSGEEPYTLSIVMQEFQRRNPGKLSSYSVLATDISTRVLNKAAAAVYSLNSVQKLPIDMKRRYFLKGKDPQKPLVRVKPEIRGAVSFARLNFMDADFGFRDTMQIIFCRNVLIYFDKPTQESVIRKFMNFLEPGGYLFLGHSETIFGMNLPLQTVAPTVFQKI